MAKIVFQTGAKAGHEHLLRKEKTLFGRQSHCDVQVLDSVASREHFIIRQDGIFLTLLDLDSRNGTKVNDQKVHEKVLDFGDRIRVGEAEYLLVREPQDTELRDVLKDRFQILAKVGEGGMGLVFKVRQLSMDRIVALKVLAPKFASRPRFVERFIKEARAAGALNHANIIQVHDVSSENGLHFFTMEFVDGQTCMQILRERGAFEPTQAIDIVRQIARALEFAHDHRIVHRDIKPDNIMLGPGRTVKLADLGISKNLEDSELVPGKDRVVGTPHYMAPEIALGWPIDHRVDVYGLGATLFHLLIGRPPFSGVTPTDILKAQVKDPVPSLTSLQPSLPPSLDALVQRMMAKELDERFPSMAAVVTAIDALMAEGHFNPDRPTGETVLLRRLASKPEPGTATETDPLPQPPALRKEPVTAPVRNQPIAPAPEVRAASSSRRRQRTDPVQAVLLVVVIVLALSVVGVLAKFAFGPRAAVSNHQAPPPESANLGTTGAQPLATAVTPIPQATGPAVVNPRKALQLEQIQKIKSELPVDGETVLTSAMLESLKERIDDLVRNPVDQDIADRAGRLKTQIDAVIAIQLRQTHQQLLSELTNEIDALRRKRNYPAARARLEAFKTNKPAEVLSEVERMAADLQRQETTFLEDLKARIDTYIVRKDAARLRAERDDLPESMLDSDLAKRIAEALSSFDRDATGKLQKYFDQARTCLMAWQISETLAIQQEHAEELRNTQVGRDLANLVQTANALKKMIAALDEGIRNADKRPRYPGALNSIIEPDLLGAQLGGLDLMTSDGGRAAVAWHLVTREQWNILFTLVLGEGRAKDHQAAIEAIFKLRNPEPAPKPPAEVKPPAEPPPAPEAKPQASAPVDPPRPAGIGGAL